LQFALETIGLSKQYNISRGKSWKTLPNKHATLAVDQIFLQVKQGELFGLVGPNGAGKTTLIKMLSTLIVPTAGSARVLDYPLNEDISIKKLIGLVTTDERSFYWRLTGRQNLEFFATLHSLSSEEIRERVNEVLDIVKLQDAADFRFQTYSTGMRQRLSIARAMIHQPILLFLDEPTKGLDPPSIKSMHHLIRKDLVDSQQITVFLTSHWLEEVEQLCDRIAIMNYGQIITCGTMPELRKDLSLGDKYMIDVINANPIKIKELQNYDEKIILPPINEGKFRLELRIEEGSSDLDDVLDKIKRSEGQIIHLSHEKISLDDVFSHYLKRANDKKIISEKTLQTKEGNLNVGYPGEYTKPPIGDSSHHSEIKPYDRLSNPFRIPWAFLKRDFRVEISYRFSFFLQFFNVFFSIALFYFLASFMGEAAAPYLEPYGGDYFAFVLIGIAFAGYFGVGLSSFADSLRQAQTTGTLEAMLTTPTSLSTIIISSSLWSYLMTTFRVALYLFIGAVFLDVDLGNGNYPLALLVLILTIISFSSLGIIAASFIMVLKRGNPITWFFNATSNLLGGIYYPITVLPTWLLFLSYLLPITYALRAMRLTLLQGETLSSLWPDILALILFCLILLPASLIAFSYAVRKSKIDGSITHY
jgi:ABC-2 type transport system permease protein